MLEIFIPYIVAGFISIILHSISTMFLKKHYYKNRYVGWDAISIILEIFSCFGTFISGIILIHLTLFLIHLHSLLSLLIIVNFIIGIVFCYFKHKEFLNNFSFMLKKNDVSSFKRFYYEKIVITILLSFQSIIFYYLIKIIKNLSFSNIFNKSCEQFIKVERGL